MAKGVESVCVNHPGVEAIGHCKQCNKPFCSACRVQGPTGNFCSQGCKEKHEAFVQRAQQHEDKRGRLVMASTTKRWVKRAVILVIVLILLSLASAFTNYNIPILSDIGWWIRNLIGK
ncbi:MAG TPA: hypothetical protein HPP77_05945 [Candidatus Hydrogenedentes bacterium]|nr:hypothetical protein [Candidatus Hydrogenedentota bacterium]HIJ74753.1 hypothetical protein [Candidatus Hydrogenedentota bacterium]